MNHKHILIGIALFLFCSTGVHAQSEEQTVAFIISGIEAGVDMKTLCSDGEVLAPESMSVSPARYRFKCKDGTIAELLISRTAKCRYLRAWIINGKNEEPSLLDFNRFQTLLPYNPAYRASHFFVANPGFCTGKSDCSDLFTSIDNGKCCAFSGLDVPYIRRERAIAYLFSKFCSKGAF